MKRPLFRLFRCKRLEALEERVARLEEALEGGASGTLSALCEDAGVPLSRVLHEYLWGKEENLS